MNLKKKKNQLIFEHHKKVGLYHWVIFSLFFFNNSLKHFSWGKKWIKTCRQ